MDTKKTYYNDASKNATMRYQAAHMEQLRIWAYRRDRIKERAHIAAARLGTSAADYMRRAITARLDADGVTLDSLPPVDPDAGGPDSSAL